MDEDTMREALKASHWEDDEASLLDQMLSVFKGRNGWLNVIALLGGFVSFGVWIFSTVKFFRAEEPRAMMMWLAVWLFCMIAVTLLKVWFWMRMDRNSVIREVKRVELRVADLARRLEG